MNQEAQLDRKDISNERLQGGAHYISASSTGKQGDSQLRKTRYHSNSQATYHNFELTVADRQHYGTNEAHNR